MIKFGLDKIDPSSLIPRKRIIEEMGVPSTTFHRWTSKKESINPLPTIKIRNKVFVSQGDWSDWVEKHRR